MLPENIGPKIVKNIIIKMSTKVKVHPAQNCKVKVFLPLK
jgi:hypothetical protein